ncbi:MAG: histidine kinase [Ferruginibacter sp.]|nr:histidine kinase [Ferruginibacter sp.]
MISVTQDGKGFMWITTPGGLQRYDGTNFKTYSQIAKNKDDGSIYRTEIFADKEFNVLWLGSDIFLEKMSFEKNYSTAYDGDKLLKDSILRFVEYSTNKNEKWLLNNYAVYYYDSIYKKYNLYHVNIFPANYHHTSFISADTITKETWVPLWTKMYLFDKKTLQIYSHNYNPYHHPLLNALHNKTKAGGLRYVMKDSKKNIWVTTWSDTLYKYDDDTKKVKIYLLSNLNKNKKTEKTSPLAPVLVNCLVEDDHHTIWAGTENAGLLRYNYEKDNFDYCVVHESKKGSIKYGYKIFCVFQDKEENIWVGTDKGISIFNPYRQYFKTIRHEENNTATIYKNEFIGFAQATNGDIFIGTWGGGMGVYNSNFNFKKNIFLPYPAENNFIWSFVQPNDKTLWIGCQQGYLQIYNLRTGAVKTLHPPEIRGHTIRCMQKDNTGNVWLGLQNGKIVKWDKTKEKFFTSEDDVNNVTKISPVENIFIDSKQQCWVSTQNGLRQFNLTTKRFTQTWVPIKNNLKSISSKHCGGIEELNDSMLVIATLFGGLNFFNTHTKEFSQMRLADGLPSDNIHAVKKDKEGFLWFTTDYNLYKLNINTKRIIPYKIEQGVINSSFTATNFYPLQDGQWLTFTLEETVSFFPYTKEKINNKNSKIEITGFKIFNNTVFIDSLLTANKPVTLSYKQNFFTVEYAALNFSSLQQINYYHQLVGIDKDWVNGGAKRSANYTDLQPGKYIFQVKAEEANSQGEITSFEIIITPPFWKTWWFTSLILFSIFLLFYCFIKWRIKSVKIIAAEKLKVQKLNAERYKNKLELEQIINYFSNSLIDKKKVDEVLWDVAKNLIARMGFVDCIIYLWNNDKTKMIQKAGIGPKGTVEEITKQVFDVMPGQGIVGYVMQHKEAMLVSDTSKDSRYRADEMERLSEITVPIIYNTELLGIIDSEHPEKDFYTMQHLQVLTTIATLVANKIKSIEVEQSLQQTQIEMYSINEQLAGAKLDALRSQMNPHFIFNCINSIDALIQSNDKYYATVYLNKFAKLLRNILDGSKQNTVTLSKDIDTLKLYVELEQLRHENKFTAQIYADDFLLQSDYKVPPLIIQPFVENAILHGIRYRTDNNGEIIVSVTKKDNYLQYVIEDNGVGRSFHETEAVKEKTSYGIDMTNDRVKLFNNEEKASIEIKDLTENNKPSGTRVTVLLKLK